MRNEYSKIKDILNAFCRCSYIFFQFSEHYLFTPHSHMVTWDLVRGNVGEEGHNKSMNLVGIELLTVWMRGSHWPVAHWVQDRDGIQRIKCHPVEKRMC